MQPLVIHADLLSPYGWSARMVAAEKGVPYEMAPADVTAADYEALHPFRKMPVLRHGAIVVYETLAIAHYIDRAFDGPALQPSDPLGQARVLTWISLVNGYMFPTMNGLVKVRFAMATGGELPEPERLAAMQADQVRQVAFIAKAVETQPWLTGEAFTLADAFLFPHLQFASMTPEGAQAVTDHPAAAAWLDRVRARPSATATNPMTSF